MRLRGSRNQQLKLAQLWRRLPASAPRAPPGGRQAGSSAGRRAAAEGGAQRLLFNGDWAKPPCSSNPTAGRSSSTRAATARRPHLGVRVPCVCGPGPSPEPAAPGLGGPEG